MVHGGEWVKIRTLMNKRFPGSHAVCSVCRRCSCANVWLSIKTQQVQCTKCFDPYR